MGRPKDAVNAGVHRMVDSKNNSKNQYDPNTPLHQDPYIYIGPGDTAQKGSEFLSLAVRVSMCMCVQFVCFIMRDCMYLCMPKGYIGTSLMCTHSHLGTHT